MHETLEEAQIRSRKPIDGNLKVYIALISLLIAQISSSSQIVALIIFTALGLYADSRSFVRVLKIPIFFLLAALAVILITVEGEKVFGFWILSVSDRALKVAAETMLRSLSSLSVMGYMVITTTIPEFVSALSVIRLPSTLIEVLFLAYRAIQIIFDEIAKLDIAASLRMGYSNAFSTLTTTSLLAFSTFMRAMKRAEIMEDAMNSRCYCGKYPLIKVQSKGFAMSLAILACLIAAWWFS